MFLHAMNFGSGGVLSWIVVPTSFVDNGGAESIWWTGGPVFPKDCTHLAKAANLDTNKPYKCSATTIRCSNIDPEAKIAFLDDKGGIAVAKNVDSSSILHDLVPVRFDIDKCITEKRYDIHVSQKP
jgi:hypothetical protein